MKTNTTAMTKAFAVALCAVLAACLSFAAAPAAHAAKAKVVKPAKVVIASVTSPSVSKVTVKVKAAKRAKAYQYRIATDKKLKKGVKVVASKKRAVSFTKLKAGKKYYVRVRAYTKVGKKTVFGAWSALKAVTVKKKAASKNSGSTGNAATNSGSAGNSSSNSASSGNATTNTAAVQVATVNVNGFGNVYSFDITLHPEYAPKTVANFTKLANGGFYDGLTFHRMVAGFALQGGDPNGDGTGGSSENVVGEFAANGIANPLAAQFQRGTVAMARGANDYNSASSQFFVTLATSSSNSSSLNNNYAAFGSVDATGMKTVDKIVNLCSAGVVGNNGSIPDRANQPVIQSIRVKTVQKALTAA